MTILDKMLNDDQQGELQLEIDEKLSLVERVTTYCTSSVSVQRLVHVREIAACAEEIGAVEAVSQLLPLLQQVAGDPELAIRQARASPSDVALPAGIPPPLH